MNYKRRKLICVRFIDEGNHWRMEDHGSKIFLFKFYLASIYLFVYFILKWLPCNMLDFKDLRLNDRLSLGHTIMLKTALKYNVMNDVKIYAYSNIEMKWI